MLLLKKKCYKLCIMNVLKYLSLTLSEFQGNFSEFEFLGIPFYLKNVRIEYSVQFHLCHIMKGQK